MILRILGIMDLISAAIILLAATMPHKMVWAVGVYLPISTTFPIFIGCALRALCDKLRGQKEESEISAGMLFATGLVAGGTLTGVFSALLKAFEVGDSDILTKLQHIGESLQKQIAGTINLDYYSLIFYAVMGFILVKVALKKSEPVESSPPA